MRLRNRSRLRLIKIDTYESAMRWRELCSSLSAWKNIEAVGLTDSMCLLVKNKITGEFLSYDGLSFDHVIKRKALAALMCYTHR